MTVNPNSPPSPAPGRSATTRQAMPARPSNATLAYKLDLGPKANAELFVRATNLTNELAWNHASFIKDASPLRGRNFTFGLRTGF